MSTYLPEDVLVQILSWLHPKSLIRFNCVCKSWAANYCNNLHRNSHILVNHGEYKTKEVVFYSYNSIQLVPPLQCLPPTFSTQDFTTIIGSCNGLICVTDIRFDDIVIWNPKTRQHKLLPRPNIKEHPGFRELGFGFDANTNDYKVVKLCLGPYSTIFGPNCKYRGLVFSLNTGSWRAPLDHALLLQHKFLDPGIYWNNVCTYGFHSWLCTSGVDHFAYSSLVTFDMSSELLCETLLPHPITQKQTYDVMPSEINRRVALVVTKINPFREYRCEYGFDVWLLGRFGDKDSWSKLFTIAPEKSLCGFYPLGFWKDYRSMFMYNSREGELVLYDSLAQVERVLGRANHATQLHKLFLTMKVLFQS